MCEKKDFFVSRRGVDQAWATWIAEMLENVGYTTMIQDWDFEIGGNIKLNMQKGLEYCERYIAVISKDYFDSVDCNEEWTSMMTTQLNENKTLLIPIKISCFYPTRGLFNNKSYIDLYEVNEKEAQNRLLNGIKSVYNKPRKSKGFPGGENLNRQQSKAIYPPNNINAYTPENNVYRDYVDKTIEFKSNTIDTIKINL